MLAKNVSVSDVELALAKVNEKYDGNIRFKDICQAGRNVRFSLTVNNSKGPGARWNHNFTRRVAAACWHVHGELFDALPAGTKIVANGENILAGDEWKDSNHGSLWNPVNYSSLCNCGN